MRLYHVQYDGVCYYVEAESFARAIELWKADREADWGEPCEDEPESVALINNDPVIRALAMTAAPAIEAKAAPEAIAAAEPEDYRVNLEIYKPGGKFYTEGHYITKQQHMYEIFQEVREKVLTGRIPGLREGSHWSDTETWMVAIRVPGHPNDHPHIIPSQRRPVRTH